MKERSTLRLAAWFVTLVVVAAACGQAPTASTGTSLPAASVGASGAAASSAPGVFASTLYPYSITLPDGWGATPAKEAWNGTGAPAIDDPGMDVFLPPGSVIAIGAFGAAARTTSKLADWVGYGIRISAMIHSTTCPATPDSQMPVTIGGQPGTLVAWNCGILINTAYAVVNGYGYRFGFRDPAVQAATDPTDEATFTTMLGSVVFH